MVKIPFTPDEPSCLLVARDLELEGIPVNLTGTFSVRQVVAAALLSNASRTNVFLGRINQDLQSGFLAEHVCLEAQRTLRRLRADDEVQTLLIVARVPDWRALIRLAGCDVITAPCDVYRDFLSAGLSTHEVASRLKYSYAENLEIPKTVIQSIGRYQIAGLYRIQEEQIQLLRALRSSEEYRRMQSGEELRDALERAGFTGLFHSPSEEERAEIEQDDFSIPRTKLSRRLALDTLFSLRVDAEFRRRQEQIDQELGEWVDQ
jgi:transaldolase